MRLRQLAPVLWAGLIYATSTTVITMKQLGGVAESISRGAMTSDVFLIFWGAVWFIFVKGWHMTEFGVLYWLLKRAGLRPMHAALTAAVYAALDEWHQTFVAARGGHASDVLIDLLGILAAWLIIERVLAGKRSLGWLVGASIAGAAVGLSLNVF